MADNKKILFLDILTDNRHLRKIINKKIYRGSTYSEAMRKAFGLPKTAWVFADAAEGKFPKDFSRFDALVMGGSTEDPMRGFEKPWMMETYKFIRRAVKKNIPILGICGGFQFVLRALGGEIILNPKGREFGSVTIAFLPAGRRDPLFYGFGRGAIFQSSHKCMMKKNLPGWKLLASSDLCRYQALAIGKNIRLIQFHPEMKAAYIRALARMRKKNLLGEGFVKNNVEFVKFLSSVKNTETAGKRILKNFLKYFVKFDRIQPVC